MTVRAMKAGVVEFPTKPFKNRNLLEAIRAAVERNRAVHKKRVETAELHIRYKQLTTREREVMAPVITDKRIPDCTHSRLPRGVKVDSAFDFRLGEHTFAPLLRRRHHELRRTGSLEGGSAGRASACNQP